MNLAVFVVALPFGLGIEAMYVIVGWRALTAAYPFQRVVQYWNGNPDQTFDLDMADGGMDGSGDRANFEAYN